MDISSPSSPSSLSSPHDDDGNGNDDTMSIASSIPLPATPREVEETLVRLSTALRFSQEKNSHSSSPPSSNPCSTSTTPRSSITPRTPKSSSPSAPNFFPLGRAIDDDDDPFRDFEELYDSALITSQQQGLDFATTLETVRSSLRNSRSRENKFKEIEDDWDGGVDMDGVESFVATTEYSYFNNKIMEIASVKKEAERSQAVMQENPNVVLALYEILTAKQKQIQKALDKEKINEQDHLLLLERLNAVKDLLKPNHGAAW